MEQWLKQVIKGSSSTPKPQIKREIKQEVSTPLAASATATVPKVKRKKKRSKKKLQEQLPFHDSIDTPGSSIEERLERTTKEYKKKGRARALERLKPTSGWEDWAEGKKLRRQLSYNGND